MGPLYGYHPNSSKTCLLVKPDFIDSARRLFGDTGIHISSDGHRYFCCPIGNISFLKQFVSTKISQWSSELETLSSFVATQSHAAYAAITHGLSSKWTYLLRTTHLDDHELLLPLETVICSKFLPSLSGINPPNELMRT